MKTSARALPALLALTLAPACGDDLDARESDGVSTALASSTGSDATTGASDDGSSGSDGSGTTTDDSSTTTDATIDPDPSTTTDATITDTDDDTTGEPAPVCGPWPEELPQPWVGADCAHDVDCGYEGGFCLLEEEGFPCGTCSHPCDQYCDDLDGAPETFCVDAEDLALGPQGGLCVSQCDPGLLGGDGCRAGYDCVALPRFGEPDVAKGVCVPEALAPEKSGCYAELEALGVAFAPTDWPVEHPDDHPELDCVIEDPVWLYSPVGGVPFRYHNSAESSPVLVSCELAKSIHQMATLMKSMGGKEFRHLGTYNCRVISGTDTLSMHGLAEAIDLSGFVLEDDSLLTVEEHWEKLVDAPVTPEGQWLKALADARYAQMIFHIILTPNYNDAHYNHFHVDLTPGSMFYE